MDNTFVLSFDEFQTFCKEIKSGNSLTDGNCEHCKQKQSCKADRKLLTMYSIMHMPRNSTRFPVLYDLAMRRPLLLQMLPAWVYLRIYGAYNEQLPCPFNGANIIAHLNEIEKTYALLGDEESKLTFLNVLMYRLTLNRDYAMRAYSQTDRKSVV